MTWSKAYLGLSFKTKMRVSLESKSLNCHERIKKKKKPVAIVVINKGSWVKKKKKKNPGKEGYWDSVCSKEVWGGSL